MDVDEDGAEAKIFFLAKWSAACQTILNQHPPRKHASAWGAWMSATHRELAIADALETAVRVAATVEHVEFADRSSPVLTVNIDRPSDDESSFRESVGAGKRNADEGV